MTNHRPLAFAAMLAAALVLTTPAAQAQRHGGGFRGGHGHGYSPGHGQSGYLWGGLGVGLGLGALYYGTRSYPDVIVTAPPPVVYYGGPVPQSMASPVIVPTLPAAPDPVFYPRNGQSPGQTEQDRQDCNRWATTLPSAMADASVFHRATMACMDGRGYSSR